jgi:hypothetical protein
MEKKSFSPFAAVGVAQCSNSLWRSGHAPSLPSLCVAPPTTHITNLLTKKTKCVIHFVSISKLYKTYLPFKAGVKKT